MFYAKCSKESNQNPRSFASHGPRLSLPRTNLNKLNLCEPSLGSYFFFSSYRCEESPSPRSPKCHDKGLAIRRSKRAAKSLGPVSLSLPHSLPPSLGDRGSEHRPQRFPRFRYITFRTMRSAMSRAFVSSRAVRPLRRRGRPCCGRPCRLVAPLRPALPSIASPRVAAPRGARALGPWSSRCPAVMFFFFLVMSSHTPCLHIRHSHAS